MSHFFSECFCLPSLYLALMTVLFFITAFLLHFFLFRVLKRFIKKEGLFKEMVIALKRPILWGFLEIAGIASFVFSGMHERFRPFFHHLLIVLIIATLGWVLAKVAVAFYRYAQARLGKDLEKDLQKRSALTQVQFLYRGILFGIVVITVSSILMTFPPIRSLGVGLLGSAGIAGIALGVAARPILLNLMAGFQIAMTKTIKLGDAVFVENDFARVEEIHLTHVIVRTWDLRRIVMPISYFIDHPFQNWDMNDPELLGTVFLYCDYSLPVEPLREKFQDILKESPLWNQKTGVLHVTNFSEKTMELRLLMTADDASLAFQLRAHVREKLIEYIQNHFPNALPCLRFKELSR